MTTHIHWTQETWNFIGGCTPVSPGCANCYAARMAGTRLQHLPLYAGTVTNGTYNGTINVGKMITKPMQWRGPKMVFVCSMSDLFHPNVPDDTIRTAFWVMGVAAPQHTYQVLTKRPERMQTFLTRYYNGSHPYPNVWIGTTVEDQERADGRIPYLINTPAAVRFLSVEPMLEPISFFAELSSIHWVIFGGESGPKARRCDPSWIHAGVEQCTQSGVAVFVKQIGTVWAQEQGLRGKGDDPDTWPEDLRIRDYPITERTGIHED